MCGELVDSLVCALRVWIRFHNFNLLPEIRFLYSYSWSFIHHSSSYKQTNDVDPINMDINPNTWFDNILADETFVEKIDGWECTDHCSYYPTEDQNDDDPLDFDGYAIEARACGRQVKKDAARDAPWSCDAWQITLLKKKDADYDDDGDDDKDDHKGMMNMDKDDHHKGGMMNMNMKNKDDKKSKGRAAKDYRRMRKLNKHNKRRNLQQARRGMMGGKDNDDKKKDGSKSRDKKDDEYDNDDEYLVVLTLTYSDTKPTRGEAVDQCPDKVVYLTEDLEDLEFGIGAIQFVLQASFEGNDLSNPCNWDCLDEDDRDYFCG